MLSFDDCYHFYIGPMEIQLIGGQCSIDLIDHLVMAKWLSNNVLLDDLNVVGYFQILIVTFSPYN